MHKTPIITGHRKAISNILFRFKTIINTQERTYKIEERIAGLFKTGSFAKLPRLDYVLMARSYFQPACEACALDEEEKLWYQVSLVYNSNRRIITHESKNALEARSIAEMLRVELHLPFKDASERGKARWIK